MKVSPGSSLELERARGRCFYIPTTSECKKVKHLITAGRIIVSPLLKRYSRNDNVPFVGSYKNVFKCEKYHMFWESLHIRSEKPHVINLISVFSWKSTLGGLFLMVNYTKINQNTVYRLTFNQMKFHIDNFLSIIRLQWTSWSLYQFQTRRM